MMGGASGIAAGLAFGAPACSSLRSRSASLTGETVRGIDAGFNTFVTAMAIAYGLMVATVVLPRLSSA